MANEELDKELEGLEDPTPEEPSLEEEPKEEPKEKPKEDPLMAEKSRWGRRVANVERSLVEVMQKFDQFMEFQEEDRRKREDKELDSVIDEDSYLTKEDVDKLWEAKKRKEERQQGDYVKTYSDTVARLGAYMDDDTFESITKVMEENYNQKVSPDPAVAAQLNFLSAKAALFEAKTNKKKVPTKGKGDVPTELGGPSTTEPTNEAAPKLTPEAREFLAQRGLSEEWAKEALKE